VGSPGRDGGKEAVGGGGSDYKEWKENVGDSGGE